MMVSFNSAVVFLIIQALLRQRYNCEPKISKDHLFITMPTMFDREMEQTDTDNVMIS